MRCNWSLAARITFGNLRPTSPSFALQRTPFLSRSSRVFFTSSAVEIRLVEAANQPLLLSPESSTTPPQPDIALTPAQVSRAAAQAVRLSIQQHSLHDAYFIVNSMRYASLPHSSQSNVSFTKLPGIRKSLQAFSESALPFRKDVSPRLASHALLHGLIRIGLSKKAFKLAKQMVESGVPLRSRTLEAIAQTLVPLPASLIFQSPAPIRSVPNAGSVTKIQPALVKHEGTRYALRLLTLARQSHSHQKDGLFELLICACIINGEIIIASLLLGLFVNELRHKPTHSLRLDNSTQSDDNHVVQKTLQPRVRRPGLNHMDASMQRFFSRIHDAYLDPTVINDSGSRQTVLQALANLATLLDRRQLSTPHLSPLLKALYDCPRHDDLVTIIDTHTGKSRVVNAYKYFHYVLERLINNLPSHLPRTKAAKDRLMAMDISSYNSLLHYALRHRLSTKMAEAILDHMTTKRYKPLKPDTTTYNILIRSGTLLRKAQLAGTSLHEILQAIVPSKRASFPNTAATSPEIRPDAYTISSFITHITSTGQFYLIPRLLATQFPQFLNPFKRRRRRNHVTYAKAGARLGPYFFVSLITALRKARKYDLARRIWIWALKSEKMSWKLCIQSELKEGWHLPVEAYTTMMQSRHSEAKRIIQLLRSGSRNALKKGKRCTQVIRVMINRSGFYKRLLRDPSALRHRLVMQLYHSFLSRTSLERFSNHEERLRSQFRPDARFFNAALKVILSPTDLQGLSMTAEPRPRFLDHQREYESIQKAYVNDGTIPPKDKAELLDEVVKDMTEIGYPVPLALRARFVGTAIGTKMMAVGQVEGNNGGIPIHPRPYAFPPIEKHHPRAADAFYLPTYKSRGLPYRQKRRRNWQRFRQKRRKS